MTLLKSKTASRKVARATRQGAANPAQNMIRINGHTAPICGTI
jgi:hypothetical protein